MVSNIWGSLCTVSYHLQIMTVLFHPFQFGCLLFLVLVWLLWLGIPEPYRIREVKVNIPALFLILRGTLVEFAHWVWCWQWFCHIWPLLCWVMFLLFFFFRFNLFILDRGKGREKERKRNIRKWKHLKHSNLIHDLRGGQFKGTKQLSYI